MSERDRPLHRLLKSLPERKAPSGLELRVMTAVADSLAKPWWRKMWWPWPAPARMVFALVIAGLAALALQAGLGVVESFPVQPGFSAARTVGGSLWFLSQALWRLGGQPLQALIVIMTVSCAAFATGLARLALTSHA